MTLYIFNYNNYYNRIIKKEDRLEDYPTPLYSFDKLAFDPGDNVKTSLTLGIGDYDGDGNYLIVAEGAQIISRWFILDTKRTRKGQWIVTLQRDTIGDFYDDVVNKSDVLVEKGYVSDFSPLVFNKEDMTFNQIKKGEYLLKSDIGIPWLVAYLPRYHTEEGTTTWNSWSGEFKLDVDYTPDETYDALTEYPFFNYTDAEGSENKKYRYADVTNELGFSIDIYRPSTDSITKIKIWKNKIERNDIGPASSFRGTYYDAPADWATMYDWSALWQQMYNKYMEYNVIEPITNLPLNSYTNLGDETGNQMLLDEGTKTIQVGADMYKVFAKSESEYEFETSVAMNEDDGFGLWCWQKIWKPRGFTTHTTDMKKTSFIVWDYTLPTASLTLSKITQGEIKYNFTYDSIVTEESPYEIIAAPYGNVTLRHGLNAVAHDRSVATSWFIELAKASGAVYDIQIVPFVGIDKTDLSDYKIVQAYLKDDTSDPSDDVPVAWAIKLPSAQFSATYNVPTELPIDLSSKKISNECDLYRLVSPNGMGEFEFSPAKNNGFARFEVDCTLMPYNPYIKVTPVFSTANNTLYGDDWNDFRGLICGGDFSLPVVTDEWKTYQLQNKNYQASFDRQIASMEKNNNFQLGRDIASAAAGTFGGVAAGFVGSGGNVYGAIAGGAAAAGAGIADVIMGAEQRQEAIDLARAQFEYQLQTIQARPNTLSRTTSFNINNKYFPYVEYYTCTDEEKEILKKKLKYTGMTVMAIGHIKDYINELTNDPTYIKGKLLKFESDAAEDYHIVNSIAGEITKGVYLK